MVVQEGEHTSKESGSVNPHSYFHSRIFSESVRSQPPQNRPFPPSQNSEPFLGLSSRSRRNDPFDFNITSPPSSQPRSRLENTPPDMLSTNNHFITPQSTRLGRHDQTENQRPNPPSASDITNKPISYPRLVNGRGPYLNGSDSPRSQASNDALKAARISTASATTSAAMAAPLSVRNRRQSQFPLPSREPSFRQSRQSVTPGVIPTSYAAAPLAPPQSRDLPSATGLERQISNPRAKPRMSMANGTTLRQITQAPSPYQDLDDRNLSRVVSNSSNVPSPLDPRMPSLEVPGENRPSVTGSSQIRHVSGNRRGSSTLARAVSPTDTRRSRRISGFNPPISRHAQSPSPPPTAIRHEIVDLPPPYTKPKTPPSSRTTPDNNIRFSTGRSLSSRSSYSSLQPPHSSTPQASSQNGHTTSTPNARMRGGERVAYVVPPVPAIPKGFGSPTSTVDEAFFESLEVQPSDTLKADSRRIKTLSMAGPAWKEQTRAISPDSKHRRRFTFAPRAANDDIERPLQAHRQSTRPRLPPLNVLPLSNETSERINSMTRKQANQSSGIKTPPPTRKPHDPPSTPMTASRATFSKFDHDSGSDQPPVPRLHSSSSVRRQQPLAADDRKARPSTGKTELASRPLLDQATEKGPSSGLTWKGRSRNASRSDAKVVLPVEREDASIEDPHKAPSTSGRSRMSLRFRRASSKTPNGALQADDNTSPSASDTKSMPPPKLPASKLWTEPNSLSSSIASFRNNSEKRLPPNSIRVARDASTGAESSIGTSTPNALPNTKATHLAAAERATTSRNVTPTSSDGLTDGGSDLDTIAADDEMRKLASKRKEFEANARELDALQRRAKAKEGVSPGQASRAARLNIFESGEISDHKAIYFCGTKEAKKVVGDLARSTTNFGFDDERGDYSIVEGDHLAYRYEVVDILGKGSFGQVVRCIDHKTGKLVAIKIIRNKKRFHQQALVEVNILQRLRDWVSRVSTPPVHPNTNSDIHRTLMASML